MRRHAEDIWGVGWGCVSLAKLRGLDTLSGKQVNPPLKLRGWQKNWSGLAGQIRDLIDVHPQ